MSNRTAGQLALGKHIQKTRKARGLTQQELCDLSGISYSTLIKIERGAIASPSVFTVLAISKTLQVNIDSLLNGDTNGLEPFTVLRSLVALSHNDKERATHNSHCGQGEYEDSCKYGDPTACPKLNNTNRSQERIYDETNG